MGLMRELAEQKTEEKQVVHDFQGSCPKDRDMSCLVSGSFRALFQNLTLKPR